MISRPVSILLLCVVTTTAGNPISPQNFDHIPPEGPADIRMRNNTVYPNCERVRVSGDRLHCWFRGRRLELNREKILRVMAKGKTYSDLGLTELKDIIDASPPAQPARESDGFEDCPTKLSMASMDAAEKAGAKNCTEVLEFTRIRKSQVSFLFIVSTPANLFPATGLALGNNFFEEINFGISAAVSGPYVTAGIYYAQAHIYMNYRVTPASYFGFKLGIRSMIILTPVKSEETNPQSPNYFSSFTNASLTQYSIPFYYGWQYNATDSIEVGIDIGIRTRSSVSFDDSFLSDAAKNNKQLQGEIQNKIAGASGFLEKYERVTWLYVAYVHQF